MKSLVYAVLAVSFGLAGVCDAEAPTKSDEPIYERAWGDAGPEIAGTIYTQSWGYWTDPQEFLTAIYYYIHPGDRFADKPVFTSTYTGDRTGWSTRISPDRKTVCLFGPRSHFGPNPALRYGISYRIQYEDTGEPGLGQDTVVWLGDTQTFKWARTATVSGGGLIWSGAQPCLYPEHTALPTGWLRAGLTGEVRKEPGPTCPGQAFQVGPDIFGNLSGPWGQLTSYGAATTLLQLQQDDLANYGWGLRGSVRYYHPGRCAQVSEGSWWFYNKQMVDWPVEQGSFVMFTSWPDGPDQPAQVSAKFFPQQGSTVVSPPWPRDYEDWSTLAGGTLSGQLSTTGQLTGTLNLSENKLVLRVTGGQEIVFRQPNQFLDLELHQRDMSVCAAGYQAFLRFDTDLLEWVSGSYASAPYGLPAISPIAVSSSGEIDMAAGINVFQSQPPFASDARLADLRFRTRSAEGITQVVFRDHDPGTQFTDDTGNAVQALAVSGPVVVIDGTPPVDVTVAAEPSGWTSQQFVTITFSALDALSGVSRYELAFDGGDYIPAISPYLWDTASLNTCTYVVNLRAVDRAGNSASGSTTVYIDRTAPLVAVESAKQSGVELIPNGTAYQGTVEIYVSASDEHSGLDGTPNVFVMPAGGNPQPAEFKGQSDGKYRYEWTINADTPNGTAVIMAEARDRAGNSVWAEQRSFNVNKSQLYIEADLRGVSTAVTRRVKLVIGGNLASGVPAETMITDIEFNTPVMEGRTVAAMRGTAVLTGLSNAGQWSRLGAKDEQHTLMSTVELTERGDKQFFAAFTGPHSLRGGDATNDNLIDILDFGVLIGQFGKSARPWPARDADFDCSGVVEGSPEFSFIQTGFLSRGDQPPGFAQADSSAEGPAGSVSVAALAGVLGWEAARAADLNGDGTVDVSDIEAFVRSYLNVRR